MDSLQLPAGSNIVEVRLIDTGFRRTEKASKLFDPIIPGFETVILPSWSFLISHGSTHVLFDLGIRKDWLTGFPPVFDALVGKNPSALEEQLNITVCRDVRDVLDSDHGLDLKSTDISAVIWSHHHFDHRGDMSRFPQTTELIVGPGFSDANLPTYPTNPDGELAESDICDRTVHELSLDDFKSNIGGFPAYDHFGDGSFYLLSSPGHTVGHLSALARTNYDGEESTFLFLAGDCAHHAGVFRPSSYIPLPRDLRTNLKNVASAASNGITDMLLSALPGIESQMSATAPFLEVDEEPMCENHVDTVQSRDRMQLFDASDNVVVCIAHDPALSKYLPTFPASLNKHITIAAKRLLFWDFLADFEVNVE